MTPSRTRLARVGAKKRQPDGQLPDKLEFAPLRWVGWGLAALGKPLFYGLMGIVWGLEGGAFLLFVIGRTVLGIARSIGKVGKWIWQFLSKWRGPLGFLAGWPSRVILGVKLPSLAKFGVGVLRKLKWPRWRWWGLPTLRVTTKRLGVLVLGIVFIGFAGATWLYLAVLDDLPQPGKLVTRNQQVSTKIYDRNGELLYRIFKDQNRSVVTLAQVPVTVRQATVAIEDAEFYTHPGFSWRGIARAIFSNLESKKLTGGSTITQQLVKNALLSPERTLVRKIKEVILAVQVESRYSKNEILEMYLNEVGYGGTAYGIEAAAETYFGKKAADLNLSESALLAGLPASPTTYSPFGAHPELAKERQRLVLSRMVAERFIGPEEAEKAAVEPLVFAPQRTDIKAPHFVMYVKQLLVEKYGEEMVEQGGLEVVTSLDLELQKKVQEMVTSEVENLARLSISNGAALVTMPATGEILAMVGSKDYFDSASDGNYNVTTALRQPGSAIKPVTYALALENGYTAGAILSDTPITFSVLGQPPYSPVNYDGRFHGPIPLRVALASSYNVPAVKTLASLGVSRMIDKGEKMGITTWGERGRFGLSLTLGGGEVKMTDMAVVYGTLANGGERVNLAPILSVKDYRGKNLEEYGCTAEKAGRTGENFEVEAASEAGVVMASESDCKGERAVEPGVAFILTNILSDNNARTLAFGPNSTLHIPNHPEVAVKTGTTNNLRDNWAIGYNQKVLVATWVGNNDNRPMSYVASGVTGASPIWRKIMDIILTKDESSLAWPIPNGVMQIDICAATGTLPCDGCSNKKEWFVVGTEPKVHCQLQPQEGKPKSEQEEMWRKLIEEQRKRI